MRTWIRLAFVAVVLVAIAMGLVHVRTETACAGNRLQGLWHRRRALEKRLWQLHLAIADLKTVERLRENAAEWRRPGLDDETPVPAPDLPPPPDLRSWRLAERSAGQSE